MKKLFFAATFFLCCSVASAQLTPYQEWRWTAQNYFPGQNFNQVSPPIRYVSPYGGTTYIAQKSYLQPTTNRPGGTIIYLTPARRNALTIQDASLPQKNHAYTRSKKAKP